MRSAPRAIGIGAVLLLPLLLPAWVQAAPRRVTTRDELAQALASARPGDVIRLAPGIYAGGLHLVDLKGTARAPIVVRAEDPARPPVIRGGANGFQLSDAEHVVLENLTFEGRPETGSTSTTAARPRRPRSGSGSSASSCATWAPTGTATASSSPASPASRCAAAWWSAGAGAAAPSTWWAAATA
jgi:hypothetical protein